MADELQAWHRSIPVHDIPEEALDAQDLSHALVQRPGAKFYTSIFPNSTIGTVTRYGPDSPGPEGSLMTIDFELDGNPFVALNGGPDFTFSEAISFVIPCADQAPK